MVIYFSLLIPIITAVILYFFFAHKTLWWEFCIPFVASLLFIVGMKATIEYCQVQCKEYWGSLIDRVEYYEDWNEWITQTCTRQCCCDSKGQNCSTETYDCSYCQYHPAVYQIITTNNEVVEINRSEYEVIKHKFNNESFSDLGRNYYTDDGDLYVTRWPKDTATAISVTTLHHYENRIKVADQSVFHFEPVSEADKKHYNLKDYPEISGFYKMPCILGDYSPDARAAEQKFQYLNGSLGSNKQVRVFVLVFKNQPVEAAMYQEWLWSGANMNELVICVGIDALRNVKWCKPISWTRSELLKAQIKDFVQQQKKLNLSSVAAFMQTQVNSQWQRRSFKEFDYLTVEPSTGALWLTFILTLLINVGLSYWVITNEFDENASKKLYTYMDSNGNRKKWRRF